jgi:hypothetical protein
MAIEGESFDQTDGFGKCADEGFKTCDRGAEGRPHLRLRVLSLTSIPVINGQPSGFRIFLTVNDVTDVNGAGSDATAEPEAIPWLGADSAGALRKVSNGSGTSAVSLPRSRFPTSGLTVFTKLTVKKSGGVNR